MGEITAEQVRSEFPELSFTDDFIQSQIDLAYRITNINRDATLYCVGHLLTISNERTGVQDGGFGEVVKEAQAGQEITYMAQARNEREVFFSTTSYGRMVLLLESRSPKRPVSVVVA